MNLAGAAIAALTTIGVTLLVTREFSKQVAGAFFAATSLFVILSSVASLGASNGAGSVVAALGFEEGYSRGYLAVHWFTDILGGFIDGCLLLAVFVAAVQMIAGRPTIAAAASGERAGTDTADGNAARAGLARADAAGAGAVATANAEEVPT